jgi:ComF family protein
MKIVPPRCSSCGIPFQSFSDGSEYLCGNCVLALPPFSGARAFGYYADELSRLIQGLKFHGRRNLVELLATLLTRTFFDTWDRGEFDFLVPVPLYPTRKRERGFNQSELLARSLTRRTAIPCSSVLARVRATLPQVGLTDSQRAENVRKAFRCPNPAQVSGRRILLIDDVMTTGATVSSAARTLLEAGALRVSVLTVARVGKW